MIWYVVTDSVENYRQYIGSFASHKLTLERLADDCCLMLHYKQVTPHTLAEARPWAICHSGGSAPYATYDVLEDAQYTDCITHWDIPQIGFCGGHQVLAMRFGCAIGPMRLLHENEADPNPAYMAGQVKEWGVYPVRIVQQDPLFGGLGDVVRVQEYHGWEIKSLGPDLRLLASSECCEVQTFVHKAKPLYGTQFHPEQSPDAYRDGDAILRNFFALAREYTATHNGNLTPTGYK